MCVCAPGWVSVLCPVDPRIGSLEWNKWVQKLNAVLYDLIYIAVLNVCISDSTHCTAVWSFPTALSAVLARVPEAGELPLWDWSSLVFPLPQDSPAVQHLLLSDHHSLHGRASSNPPPKPHIQIDQFHWDRDSGWHGKENWPRTKQTWHYKCEMYIEISVNVVAGSGICSACIVITSTVIKIIQRCKMINMNCLRLLVFISERWIRMPLTVSSFAWTV